MIQILYDPRDDPYHERIGSQILYWLDDLGAIPLSEADPGEPSFLFAGARPVQDYRQLIARLPLLRDRPQEREPLLRLDTVLEELDRTAVRVPMACTWILPLDAPVPADLTFPLFLRTADSSWKKGGRISRVETPDELADEATALRRALGWDAVIMARAWMDLATAGEGRYGPMPQEIRTWIVDGIPFAWSFHHLHIVPRPLGFPPSPDDSRNCGDLRTRSARRSARGWSWPTSHAASMDAGGSSRRDRAAVLALPTRPSSRLWRGGCAAKLLRSRRMGWVVHCSRRSHKDAFPLPRKT